MYVYMYISEIGLCLRHSFEMPYASSLSGVCKVFDWGTAPLNIVLCKVLLHLEVVGKRWIVELELKCYARHFQICYVGVSLGVGKLAGWSEFQVALKAKALEVETKTIWVQWLFRLFKIKHRTCYKNVLLKLFNHNLRNFILLFVNLIYCYICPHYYFISKSWQRTVCQCLCLSVVKISHGTGDILIFDSEYSIWFCYAI